ncbi:MAG: Re/Si-specific NAD(P)(+) transhydrogenase subunit alpha [Hyphomicrobiales bacterium]|nr:Re/Si-specific NAD(P)(+) transhydrogenase subunit alpha [Hyphomicrobiales bacterium]
MKLAVPAESAKDEPRVAATPETVKKLTALGFEVTVQAGAGVSSRILDEAFANAGAKVIKTPAAAVKDADIVLRVRRPTAEEAESYKRGALVIGIMDPFAGRQAFDPIARAGLAAMAMELMPRITRAQAMDVLSSQANLAGYRAVIDAAEAFDRALPMMMTAAGTVSPAKAFVMGAGVAGLQAIATARRLGAVVSATDVRPAAKEQVESLGAKFIAVEDEEFRQAETEAGYAKEMSDAYKKKQAELIAAHIAKQDIVITTALVPGRPAPVLISKEMVESMAPGSVIVDLAVERGGNCALSRPGETVEHRGVTIVGHLNVAGSVAASASYLYARNLFALVEIVVDREKGELAVDWQDEIVKAITLTRDGKIVHPLLGASGGGKAKGDKA